MHHIHHTEAIVLGGQPKGEADKRVVLYTRDRGLVQAEARGIRKISSRLRFAVQPYVIVQADLIDTRSTYRIGSTEIVASLSEPGMAVLGMLHRLAALLRRLAPEEEKNEPLYEAVKEVIVFSGAGLSERSQRVSTPDTASLELLAVFRVLYHLGYITGDGERTLVREPITFALLAQVAMRRESLVREVNQSLRETML